MKYEKGHYKEFKQKLIDEGKYEAWLAKRREYDHNRTPEQRAKRLADKSAYNRNRYANDDEYRKQQKIASAHNRYKRSPCYGCENWKWIAPPFGQSRGSISYCRLYPNTKAIVNRITLCDRLREIERQKLCQK